MRVFQSFSPWFLTSCIALILFSYPTVVVLASTVSFEVIPNTVLGDSATIVEVTVDPEGKVINAIEGILQFQTTQYVEISSVVTETGDSAFSLWPVDPIYNDADKTVRFAGGVTKGFTEEDLVFRMRIFTAKGGQVSLAWIGGNAYVDDGLGTPDPVSSRSVTLLLSQSIPNPINPSSADSQPPTFDTVEIGQNEEVYEGKAFISFHAIDDVSGIDRYVVTENNVVTEVKDGVYVFQDQERKVDVLLTAFDKAGNSTSVKVPSRYDQLLYLIIAVIGFMIVMVLIVIMRKKIGNIKK